MKENLDDYDRLVGMLYDVAVESPAWEGPMNELMRQIGASGFHFLGWDSERNAVPFAAWSDSWHDFIAGYHIEYGKIDPHLQAGLKDPVGHWLVSHHRFDERFVKRDRCYQEYLIPSGVRHLMGTSLVRGKGVDVVAAVGRPLGAEPFSADDIALVKRITPHMQRAVKIHLRTAELRQQAAIGEAGLNAMDTGVLALDITGRILFANHLAEKMLQAATCLRTQRGRFGAALRHDDKALLAAIEGVSASRVAQSIRVRHVSGEAVDSCTVALIPLPQDNRMKAVLHGPDMLALVGSSKHRPRAAASDYMELFGLTAAESRLAEGLAAGLTVDDYAAGARVTKATVRAHLKAVFLKTGVRRQSELMHVLGNVSAAPSAAARA